MRAVLHWGLNWSCFIKSTDILRLEFNMQQSNSNSTFFRLIILSFEDLKKMEFHNFLCAVFVPKKIRLKFHKGHRRF